MIVQTENVYLFWQTDSTFSNWTQGLPYTLGGVRFATSEHGMMYEKARRFDPGMCEEILAAKHPRDVKALGRAVSNFDPEVWNRISLEVFVPHLVAKFEQNPRALDELLGTGTKIIAESSPYDRVWGTGIRPNDEKAADPRWWIGENRLGKALMQARTIIRED